MDGPDRPAVVERDLEVAELLESSGFQQSLVAGGLLALVAVPLAWVLASARAGIARLVRSRRARG